MKNCASSGICEFWIDITNEQTISLINDYKNNNDGLSLSFNNEILKVNTMSKTEYLILDNRYIIDQRTSKTLIYKKSKILKQGRYPITLDVKSQPYYCTINY